MTREDFFTRILGSASSADLLYNLREGLRQMDLEGDTGEPLTPDHQLAELRFEPQNPGVPAIRIKVTLEEMTIYSQGVKMSFPAKCICEILSNLEELHDGYHLALESLIQQAFGALSTEQEKVLAQLLHDNPLNPN